MLITSATYVLFGALCLINPDDPKRWPVCMNFWQNPIVHYKTIEDCEKQADKYAKHIKKEYENRKLIVDSLEITCISTGNDPEVDRNLKIEYNIL